MNLRDLLKYKDYFKNYVGETNKPKIHMKVTEEGHMTIPVLVKDQKLSDFINAFYESDALHPRYKDFLDERKIEVRKIENYAIYTKEELLAILTYMVRADRFVEGYLIKRARNGQLYQILKNLEKLI